MRFKTTIRRLPWIALVALSGAAPERPSAGAGGNLALVATATTSYVSPHETIKALNDGYDPRNSDDKSHGAYGNWPVKGTQWVEYDWTRPIKTRRIDIYWFDDHGGVRVPKACRLEYWDGHAFVPVPNPTGLGLSANRYNTTTFDQITTSRLRLETDSAGESTGLLQWKVYDAGGSPNFAPVMSAGVDRVVVIPGETFLSGSVLDDGKPGPLSVKWTKESGPGDVTIADPTSAQTTATFTAPGQYRLKLSANDGELSGDGVLNVSVQTMPKHGHLTRVELSRYTLTSPFWKNRIKALVCNWIPHCARVISDPDLPEGGIQNFVEAGRKIAGKPHGPQHGAVFANAWVYNTVEAMCDALMLDPQGDADLLAAQKGMRETLEDWIPKILSAQEPDGYLQTFYTLNNRPRWTNKFDHEGYQAGYFIEAAIAHYEMTGHKDARLYNAARKLADCWCNNIGPSPKRYWYEGHEELEQALVRLSRFVDQNEGTGAGRRYLELAKFLMDCRRNGETYDQSHLSVTRQYEAVGHAVRAAYLYSGMADIAMETGSPAYQSAIRSIWDDIVNRKYYLTGGIGSGETSEGFGADYSLPNNSYCESCADCGELFFQYKMNQIDRDARYADLYEDTIYNAILGSLDLDGNNFFYTNGLDASQKRYPWHGCPCCVGNIARTLLMLPTWTYARDDGGLYVNLFVGGATDAGRVAGTDVRVVQETNYPWDGNVSITVNPAEPKQFAVRVRVPNRNVSRLYTSTPSAGGLVSLAVNGSKVTPEIENGYVVLTRTWHAGDKIELVLPLPIERVKCSDKVKADLGRVALRRGPLVYNIESVDQNVDSVLPSDAPLSAEWQPGFLDGVTVIKGTFADGKPMVAIPNYARLNRGGRSVVWIRDH